MAISLHDQLACAKRELSLRHRVYQKWVAEGKMDELRAQKELAGMEAIVATLQGLCEQQTPQGSLFGGTPNA